MAGPQCADRTPPNEKQSRWPKLTTGFSAKDVFFEYTNVNPNIPTLKRTNFERTNSFHGENEVNKKYENNSFQFG